MPYLRHDLVHQAFEALAGKSTDGKGSSEQTSAVIYLLALDRLAKEKQQDVLNFRNKKRYV